MAGRVRGADATSAEPGDTTPHSTGSPPNQHALCRDPTVLPRDPAAASGVMASKADRPSRVARRAASDSDHRRRQRHPYQAGGNDRDAHRQRCHGAAQRIAAGHRGRWRRPPALGSRHLIEHLHTPTSHRQLGPVVEATASSTRRPPPDKSADRATEAAPREASTVRRPGDDGAIASTTAADGDTNAMITTAATPVTAATAALAGRSARPHCRFRRHRHRCETNRSPRRIDTVDGIAVGQRAVNLLSRAVAIARSATSWVANPLEIAEQPACDPERPDCGDRDG